MIEICNSHGLIFDIASLLSTFYMYIRFSVHVCVVIIILLCINEKMGADTWFTFTSTSRCQFMATQSFRSRATRKSRAWSNGHSTEWRKAPALLHLRVIQMLIIVASKREWRENRISPFHLPIMQPSCVTVGREWRHIWLWIYFHVLLMAGCWYYLIMLMMSKYEFVENANYWTDPSVSYMNCLTHRKVFQDKF